MTRRSASPWPWLRRAAALLVLVPGLAAGAQTPPPADPATPAPAAPAAPAPATAAAPVDRLLVCNKADNTLSILDPATRKAVATVKTGQAPHEVAVSPDGALAVVANYGTQPGHTLTVVDVATGTATRTVQLLGASPPPGIEAKRERYLRPHGLAFVGPRHVLVTSEHAQRLLRVDLGSGEVDRTWPTTQASMHMVAATGDGRLAFATSVKDGDVAVFALGAAAPPLRLRTGEGAEGLAVVPGRAEAWIGNRAANTLSVVAGEPPAVVAELATADLPFRITFTPDGATALVACAEAGAVQLFDVAARRLAHTVEIAGDSSEQSPLPLGICCDPDGRFAYATCGRGEYVAVLDLRQRQVVARLVAGRGPDGIAYARLGAGLRR